METKHLILLCVFIQFGLGNSLPWYVWALSPALWLFNAVYEYVQFQMRAAQSDKSAAALREFMAQTERMVKARDLKP